MSDNDMYIEGDENSIDEDMSDDNEESDDNLNEEMEEAEEDGKNKEENEVYLPYKPINDGEQLVCDESAYIMLHQAQTSAPCLSFDIIKDGLGDKRETFPLTSYIVSGTQAPQTHINNIIVMKLSNLHKTNRNDDEDGDLSDEDEDDDVRGPEMNAALIKHQGCVNRIRCTTINNKTLVASWSEIGKVFIWDISEQLIAVDDKDILNKYNKDNRSSSYKPLYQFNGHQKEGFAIDWSTITPGVLASGDCKHDIHIWKPNDQSNSWQINQKPLVGHTGSVEDLQWSPNENNVLASCSIDKSIRIWDVRAHSNNACMLTVENAHESDINVISWNKNEPFVVSGGDDGYLRVYDLRKFSQKTPVAIFKHHVEPVVSVEWHPTDSPVFASAGSDNQIALWDLSVEIDTESDATEIAGIPPQLLFIHQGQTNMKELHWHPQLPGVVISTAESGFNIFKTISV